MAALIIPRGSCFIKYRQISPALGYIQQCNKTNQKSFINSSLVQGVRHHHIGTSFHGHRTLKLSNNKCKHNNISSYGLMFALRAASNSPVQDTANTFVKYTNPNGANENVYSAPLDLSSSSEPIAAAVDSIPELPDAPTLPVQELTEQVLNAAGEPTFASMGLGGWTPVGIVQNCMEYLHIGCDLPWWGSIMIGTLCVRIIIFPLVILAQRNAAKMNNNLPQMQVLQMKMTEARQSGNQLEAARYAQEMMIFMKEKELSPFRNMLVPLAQAPLFISFFLGLRKMANVPVDSMHQGGLFWFTDLTVPDQYYLLPLLTSATMYLTIEIGTDSARLSASNMNNMKYILRAMPVIIFPFIINFPGAILCYWVSTNFISLIQVGFLKIPAVREYFKIDKMIVHNPDTLPQKNKGFVKGFKESWNNMKITKELEERQRVDELQFQRSGQGPVPKTYKYDPTRQTQSTVAAKKRDPK